MSILRIDITRERGQMTKTNCHSIPLHLFRMQAQLTLSLTDSLQGALVTKSIFTRLGNKLETRVDGLGVLLGLSNRGHFNCYKRVSLICLTVVFMFLWQLTLDQKLGREGEPKSTRESLPRKKKKKFGV